MKKIISPKMIILYLLIIISTITIFTNNKTNNITYLSLGDEYALGKDSFGINSYSYSDYLKDKLKQNNQLKEYINYYRKENMTIIELKNYISNNTYYVSKKQKKSLKGYLQEADLVTLSVGMSDLKYNSITNEFIDSKKMDESLKKIESEFNSLISEIKKYYKKDIFVIGYPNNTIQSYYLSMSIRKFNEFLKNNKYIRYIDPKILSSTKNNYFLNPKSNYYNTKGHNVIAEEIYKTYEKSLKNK